MASLSEATSEELAQLWLDILPRVMRFVVTAAASEASEHMLSSTQFRILKRLSCGPKLGSELAHALMVTPPTVSAAIDSLVRKGLVERCEATEDRRAIPLQITPEGTHCFDVTQQNALTVLVQLVEQISPDERRALAQGLNALSGALESYSRS